jgi:UDP-2,4-diacetamido-2,4,6-trideoxy-beta-L-altropyranose hydrolase
VLVAFRADASVQIGTGHIMRCLALAGELTRQGHECRFICRKNQGHLSDLIASKGYELIMLPAPCTAEVNSSNNWNNTYAGWLGVPWQQDAKETLKVLEAMAADWLVVDHYALDARWEQQVAKTVSWVMVIDDLADRQHECALLLDQNLGRVVSDYAGLVLEDCLRLIGPEYALLRPDFAPLRDFSLKRRERPELKRILIALGGVDRTNVTGQVLEALVETALPGETQLDIIMGASAPYLDEVRQQAAKLPFMATVNVNVGDMAERMCLADLSIGAAGGTSWERCCLGLPAVLVILADNQVPGAKALEAVGAALTVTNPEAVQATLPSALAKIGEPGCLQRMSVAAAAITDGKGALRVLEFIMAVGRTTP